MSIEQVIAEIPEDRYAFTKDEVILLVKIAFLMGEREGMELHHKEVEQIFNRTVGA